jgi:hypothetical protein
MHEQWHISRYTRSAVHITRLERDIRILSITHQLRSMSNQPPTGLPPRLGVGCQSFTLPSSVDCDYDEGCDDTFVLSPI